MKTGSPFYYMRDNGVHKSKQKVQRLTREEIESKTSVEFANECKRNPGVWRQYSICREKLLDNPNLQYVRFKCLPKTPENWLLAMSTVAEPIGDFVESNEEGSEVIWLGQTSDKKKTNIIEDDWMKLNFRKFYREKLRQIRKWSAVPPGKRRKLQGNSYQLVSMPECGAFNFWIPVGAPKPIKFVGCPIRFWQDFCGESCLFSSMASCMWFLGRHQTARMLDGNKLTSTTKIDRFSFLTRLMQTKTREKDGKQYTNRLYTVPVAFKKGRYRPLTMQTRFPTACQLLAKDGGVEHAVTFYKNMIFDACEERAMELTEDNLRRCTGTGFDTNFFAIQFQHAKQEKRSLNK
jgi:hypothetical protein